MPIIVDEVVISVEVGNAEAGGASAAAAAAPAGEERQALVEECVARVLEILRDREEP
ncbi:MAG: hypothetical protein KA538_12810 [Azonexus sp.]|jgi:hypothetical protein|nr:hypothetical protein [Azonexus sp.]